ncbi:hypothetical protein [Staphylococcus epidermidis]|uniref:hypothetical protein n=1 Tax=Staphylococcus epidermidis TaxID=1282 RepID=UPI00119E696B|nr:hypothetical protein [Staphylococcus epidermidis]
MLCENKISDGKAEVEMSIELVKDDSENGFKLGGDIKVRVENMCEEDGEKFVEEGDELCG